MARERVAEIREKLSKIKDVAEAAATLVRLIAEQARTGTPEEFIAWVEELAADADNIGDAVEENTPAAP